MKKFPFAIFAFLLFTFHLSTFGQDTGRAAATWQVQKYDLDVTLPQDEKTRSVSVKAILNLKNVSGKPASTLTLRISPSAEITAVKINNATAEFTKNVEKITASSNLQRIILRLPSVAPDALLTAAVEYKINLKENSALSSISSTDAQFLPFSFWYPTPNSWYFAGGADDAPFSIHPMQLSVPNLEFISSGSVKQYPVDGVPDSSTSHAQPLRVQPFFLLGRWDHSNSRNVLIFTPNGGGSEAQKRGAELAAFFAEARTFCEGVFGKAPDVPLRIVSSRRGAGFNSAGTVIVDEAVFRRSKIDSLTTMQIAEAAAKLWLGGSVSVKGDGYGAITEGLSRYIATQFFESKFGKDVADVERLRQRNSYAAVSKRDAAMIRASPLEDFYYPAVANKGAMVWRIVAKRVGATEFASAISKNMQDGNLTVAELRAVFAPQKEMLDYLFDQETEMDLQVGVPQISGAEAKAALRNTGAIDVTVDVTATTESGQKITAPTTIRATDYGEVVFKANGKITRVEVDTEKLYPQSEYSNDVKPSESTDSDPLLSAKRYFDKQDFVNAEGTARKLLRDLPRFDDLRILLGRALMAQNKNTEAEREFRAVMDEKLPTARSIAWANVGLAEIASRSNQKDAALKYAEAAIIADADYGASLAARSLRTRLGSNATVDPTIKTFFADFDKAAAANRRADIDALVVPGEVNRFTGGIAGSTDQWQTQVRQVDRVDANTVLIEAEMTIKLLNKNVENGMAVYRLTKVGNGWKLIAVDMFEVR